MTETSQTVPVIMCGGAGLRLWPLSRQQSPKQFIPLLDGQTLFDLTLKRLEQVMPGTVPLCIANETHRFDALAGLERCGTGGDVLLEPVARNTAPALAAAALRIAAQTPDAIMVCLPADHYFPDDEDFARALGEAVKGAEAGLWMQLGVTPREPSDAFGYLVAGRGGGDAAEPVPIACFVEKPPRDVARQLIVQGALWNCGINVVGVGHFLQALETTVPETIRHCRHAVAAATRDGRFLRLHAAAFERCAAQSIDHAVLEQRRDLYMVEVRQDWSDVGTWDAVAGLSAPDASGNRCAGDTVAEDCRNTFVHSPDRLTVAIGLEDTMVINTRDALLVAAAGNSEALRKTVLELKDAHRPEVAGHARVERPWGAYEVIGEGRRHQVKLITVSPGAALSLQYHRHRAEHWVVVRGTAMITCGERTFELTENQSTYVEKGEVHRLENAGSERLELIEIQTGDYLGEDDIVRLEDVYGRCEAVAGSSG